MANSKVCVQCKKVVSTSAKNPILCGSIHCFAKWFYCKKQEELQPLYSAEPSQSLDDD